MESEEAMTKISGKKIKNMLCNNIMLKLASVVLAFLLWLLVINIDDPQVTSTIENIPVTILNEDVITGNNEVYDVISGSTVDVKVIGPRTIVDALKRGDFTATGDFQDLSKTNAVPIVVTLNNTRYESKVTIAEKSNNTMRLSVEQIEEKEYPLNVEFSNYVASGYVVYSSSPEVETVVVSAPKSVHENISKVAVSINLAGDETTDFEYSGNVFVYDSDGKAMDREKNHIRLGFMYIKVQGTVYYKKTVDITYQVVDNLSDGRVLTEYDSSIKTIDIVGRKEVLDGIDAINIPEELTVVTDDKTEIEVNLNDILPEGVYIYNGDGIVKITAQTEDVVRKTIKVKVGDIGIRKIPDGYEGSIINNGDINIVIQGREEDVAEIDAEKLAPYVDLTNAAAGNNRVKVNVVLPDEVSMVSEIYVNVVLTERDTETTESPETTVSQETPSSTENPATETGEPATDDTTGSEGVTGSEQETTTPEA